MVIWIREVRYGQTNQILTEDSSLYLSRRYRNCCPLFPPDLCCFQLEQGVDIIAQKDGEIYAIQCKRYSKLLGNTPVQEVVSGRSVYRCDHAIVMTNNYFTDGALRAAAANDVALWDRDYLYAMFLS